MAIPEKKNNFIERLLFKIVTKQSKKHKAKAHLCDFSRICHEIIPGDVLLMEGSSNLSQVIKKVTHSSWTHASLYLGRLHSIENPKIRQLIAQHHDGDPSEQLLLETWPGRGTVITPISRYTKEHIRICRPTGISFEDTQHVIEYAVKHLGGAYNMRHFFDLGRHLLASKWYLPNWGSSLFEQNNPSQASKDICSALIAEAFVSVDFPILPLIEVEKNGEMTMIHRNPKLFTPSNFDYSPYFSIIKYPIIPGHRKGQYHGFPWKHNLMSHDDFVSEEDPKKQNA